MCFRIQILFAMLHRPIQRWWEYRDLLKNLVAKEIKVRYQGAALGFAWSLMNPLLVTLMYLFVFTYVFHANQPNHALYLVTGILHWTLFSTLILQASDLLTGSSALLKKIYFPRLLIPTSNLLVNLILWSMALVVYLVLFIPLGGHLHWVLLLYPLYIILFLLFSFGIMLMLAIVYVDFRDIKHLVDVMMQLLFWVTPIIYPIHFLPKPIRPIFFISPLTEFTIIFQSLFWAGTLPSWKISIAFTTWTLISLWIGLLLFYKRGAQLIERL